MIYILGGKGFIGSAFVRWCQANQKKYVCITRENYQLFTSTNCEILINANGNSSKPRAAKDQIFDFEASVVSVKKSISDFKPAIYVYLSSCDVYPDCSNPESTREDQPIDITRQSVYGFHKWLAEQCVQHDCPKWLIFRMGGFVGPGLKKNAIFDIIHDSPLWLDSESELQYMSTDTLAACVMDLAFKKIVNEIYNICGQDTVRLKDIMDRVNYTGRVTSHSPKAKYQVSIQKLLTQRQIPFSKDEVFLYVDNPA